MGTKCWISGLKYYLKVYLVTHLCILLALTKAEDVSNATTVIDTSRFFRFVYSDVPFK